MLNNLLSNQILDIIVLGNTVQSYIFTAAAFIGFLAVFHVIRWIMLKKLKALAEKTKTDADDTLIEIYQSVRPPFYFYLAFYLSLKFLVILPTVSSIVNGILVIYVAYQAIKALQIFIDYLVKKWISRDGTETSEHAVKLVGKIIKGVLWVMGGLMILSNLGIEVSSLIASLGIGGIAVALAMQNILSDLFSSFAIYFDKPFIEGDFIIVGDKMGVVQKIGIKTTRIKALQGEEIVMSNKDLTGAVIQNFKKMKERRIVFSFGVEYSTSADKMKKIPDLVKKIIEARKDTRFDRAHFKQFDDSQLTYEVVYYMLQSDYNAYMDAQEGINLKVKEQFEKEGIGMAFPTRTVYLQK